MVLQNVLDFLVPVLWGLLALLLLAYVWIQGRRHGWLQAVRRLFSARLLIPLAVVVAVTIVRAALVFINPTEVGVVISLLAPNGVREQPMRSGLHWIVPLAEEVVRYPIITQSYTMSVRPREGAELGDDAIRARTADGQVVILDITALFRIDPERAVTLHIRWQDRYIHDFIRPGLRAFVRRQAAQFNVDEINSEKRQAFEAALNELNNQYAKGSGIIPEAILVRNITFSPEYATSVEEKMTALQRVTEAAYKAKQVANLANGEAEKIRITAQARADKIVIEAEATATAKVVQARAEAEALNLIAAALQQRDNLLTYRYIDKLAPNIRAMLLPSEAPLILPMPRLEEEGRNEPPAQPTATEEQPRPPLHPQAPALTRPARGPAANVGVARTPA
ncbi:MAG: SPFH domain-containing protein, partial [Candidatus Competibacterales bacterium]|nr:SPFH domain-containing protein [Candidatus Competibacterales bacterium]